MFSLLDMGLAFAAGGLSALLVVVIVHRLAEHSAFMEFWGP